MPNEQGQNLIGLIDESSDQTIYRVGALVVRDGQLAPLTAGLNYVAARAAYDYGLPPRVELHGHEIFHGNKNWTTMKRLTRARIGVYGQALDIIAAHSEAILIKGVDRHGFQRRYANRPDWNEHENALTYLIEELDGYADRQGMPMSLYADDCRFAAATIKHMARFKQWGTWGYKGRLITHIKDLTYLDSKQARGIQAADLVCYLNHRVKGKRDTDRRAIAANAQLWNRIEHLVTFNHDWWP